MVRSLTWKQFILCCSLVGVLGACSEEVTTVEIEKAKRVESKYTETMTTLPQLANGIQEAIAQRDVDLVTETTGLQLKEEDLKAIQREIKAFIQEVEELEGTQPKTGYSIYGMAEDDAVAQEVEYYSYGELLGTPNMYYFREDNTGAVELYLEYMVMTNKYVLNSTWLGGVHVETVFTVY